MELHRDLLRVKHYAWAKVQGRAPFIWLPDRTFLEIATLVHKGRRLNLRDPDSLTDKLQWLKLYDRDPLYTTLVDKIEVKKWVTEKIGAEHIVPTLGVWERPEDIDFDSLPESFVLKTNHDSGGIVICKDKTKTDIPATLEKLRKSLKRNYYLAVGREWPYKNVQRRVFAEQYLDPETSTEALAGIVDYKFYCFNGEPKFIYVSQGLHDKKTARRMFVDLSMNKTPFQRPEYAPFETVPEPPNLATMLDLVKVLANHAPFVRVDFYDRASGPLFSEMTLHPASGWMDFRPNNWDKEIGSWLTLPNQES